MACDRREPPREPPLPKPAARIAIEEQAAQALAKLQAEAGLGSPDPPFSTGSLRDQIEAFSNLDACITETLPSSPLLGDALFALGYDSLVGDACRSLQALALRDTQPCAPILARPLRHHCEISVATLLGDPQLCPILATSRDPLCLARASRDPRLCDASADSNLCRALVLGDPAICQGDTSCERQVSRWASVFESPEERAPFLTSFTIDLRSAGDPSPGESSRSFDLGEIAQQGFVVRKKPSRLDISLGMPRDGSWLPATSPFAKPRSHLALRLPRKPSEGATLPLSPLEGRFDLLLPPLASFSSVTERAEGKFTILKIGEEVGGPIELRLDATVREGGRRYELRAKIESFVRDLIE